MARRIFNTAGPCRPEDHYMCISFPLGRESVSKFVHGEPKPGEILKSGIVNLNGVMSTIELSGNHRIRS